MYMSLKVLEALDVLRNAAENDFERHRLEILIRDLKSPTNLKELEGQRFGRLTVIDRADKTDSSGNAYWKCRCDCGNITVVLGQNLRRGNTKSCGCLQSQNTINRNFKHNKSKTKIYRIWESIKRRCFNSNEKFYKNYGGRGITIATEWIHNFQEFYDYVSKLEHFGENGYSLDRIDNNGNYEPDNVRWADAKTQSRNRRTNVFVEYEGKKVTLGEAAELSGIDLRILSARNKRGDTGDRLFRPVQSKSTSETQKTD